LTVAGDFQGIATFGIGGSVVSSLTSQGATDVYLLRMEPNGGLRWARRDGGSLTDLAAAVVNFADGSCLLAGSFSGSATFGAGEPNATTLISAGDADVFLARFASDGGLVWAKRAGGAGADRALAAAVLSDGAVVLAGDFTLNATFGAGETGVVALIAAGFADIWTARFSADGTLAWARRAGGPGYDTAAAIAALPDGSIAIAGSFATQADFGGVSIAAAGQDDAFLARLGGDGSFSWTRAAGGAGFDAANSLALLSDGTLAMAGIFTGSGAQLDSARAVSAVGDASFVVCGSFSASMTLGAGDPKQSSLVSSGSLDLFVARFNADGRF
jgi:hypothetical protein